MEVRKFRNKYEDVKDKDLPEPITLEEALKNPPPLPEAIIDGVLRKGHKMIVSGCSKAGKSFLLMELCIALSEGLKWLGFQCKKCKVLYVNLEIDKASFIDRFSKIHTAMGLKSDIDDICVWHLRGKSLPLDKLVPALIRRASGYNFDAVIIDPVYKVMTGDENSARDMAYFCNQFDKLCTQLGCSVIYCHHHSKGLQGYKKAMDRASGSGVFTRDADAILDLIRLETSEEFLNFNADKENATAWRVEGSLREFPPFKPVDIWFEFPIHRVDEKNTLKKLYAEGDTRNNLAKSGKRTQTPESRKREMDEAFNMMSYEADGVQVASVQDIMEYLDVSERVIRERVREFSDTYKYKKGKVYLRQNETEEN